MFILHIQCIQKEENANLKAYRAEIETPLVNNEETAKNTFTYRMQFQNEL